MSKFATTLLPYQEEGVSFIHDKKYCIIGDEPGLGKTVQALKACYDKGFKTLIICPAYLKRNWINEVTKFCKFLEYEVVAYSNSKPFPTGFDAVIVDESSYIKSLKAQRTMKVHKYAAINKPQYLILLNGSPIKNRVEELYSQVVLVYPAITKKYPSIWSFLNRFANRTVKRYGNQEYVSYEGHRNIDELKLILQHCMIRRKADTVLDLPKINQKKVVVSYAEDKKLQQAWNDYIAGKGVKDATAKKDSAIRKAGFTAQYVLDLISSGTYPVVVFSCHPDAVESIFDDLAAKHIRVRKVVGATPMDQRSDIVKDLQAGDIEVVVASLTAFNTGWTGTKASNMVFNDVHWVPEDNVQAAKRIHRIGQDKPVFYHFVVGSKVDDHIIDANMGKKQLINAVMN
jgi:SWI/SNF-related matrix-associated actin-dependent regulator 1 of chromatin subfamily A